MLINQTQQKVDKLIHDVIAECTVVTKNRILNALTEVSATKGYLWSFTRRWFEVNAKLDPTSQKIEKEYEGNPGNVEVGQEIPRARGNVEGEEENTKHEVKVVDIQGKTDDGRGEAEDKKPEHDEHEALDLENIITGRGYFHALQVCIHSIVLQVKIVLEKSGQYLCGRFYNMIE